MKATTALRIIIKALSPEFTSTYVYSDPRKPAPDVKAVGVKFVGYKPTYETVGKIQKIMKILGFEHWASTYNSAPKDHPYGDHFDGTRFTFSGVSNWTKPDVRYLAESRGEFIHIEKPKSI